MAGNWRNFSGIGEFVLAVPARPAFSALFTAPGHYPTATALISVTADSVVRLVPSLILSTAEADEIAAILCPLISALLKEAA